jgi:hypothetical protein
VLQHALLAYHAFAPAPQPSLVDEPRSWLAFPIVDGRRSTAVAVLTTFNDIFGMALMFFLSGLFVPHGIERHGAGRYLRRRALRLGVPFAVAAVVLTPLAYYPSYLVTAPSPSVVGFGRVWLSMGLFPGAAGPAWFLWLLLAFDAVAAMLLVTAAGRTAAARVGAYAATRPVALFVRLVGVSAAAFVPLVLAFGPSEWSAVGPFKVQTSRLLHYLVYFLAGVAIGTHGVARGLLADGGMLARRWREWRGVALLAYPLVVGIGAIALAPERSRLVWWPLGGVAFALSCAASSFAVLAAFLRYGRRDGFWLRRLRADAYGIYVVHYVFVTWLQYALLGAAIPALAKGAVVFIGATALGWASAAGVRRLPFRARRR